LKGVLQGASALMVPGAPKFSDIWGRLLCSDEEIERF